MLNHRAQELCYNVKEEEMHFGLRAFVFKLTFHIYIRGAQTRDIKRSLCRNTISTGCKNKNALRDL